MDMIKICLYSISNIAFLFQCQNVLILLDIYFRLVVVKHSETERQHIELIFKIFYILAVMNIKCAL